MKQKLIAQYRHSKHQNRGMPAIVGPRTFTHHSRRWLVKVRLFLAPAPGAELQPVVDMAITTDLAVSYSEAAVVARDLIAELMGENDTWVDFQWEVWA